MIRMQNTINSKAETPNKLYREYNTKLTKYYDRAIPGEKPQEKSVIKTCVIIPVERIQLIIEVSGISKKGKVKYNLIGKLRTDHLSLDLITVVEMVFDGVNITYLKDVYITGDEHRNGVNSDDYLMNKKTLERICNVVLSSYWTEKIWFRSRSVRKFAHNGVKLTQYMVKSTNRDSENLHR